MDGYTLLVHATRFGEITPGADAVDPGSAGNDDEVGGRPRWCNPKYGWVVDGHPDAPVATSEDTL